jgi:hypothetical protein
MSSLSHFRPNMSLYIPSVTGSTTQEQIARVFKSLNIGVVSRVDFIDKDTQHGSGTNHRMAFVHFDFWYINNTSYHLQERILEQGQGKIVYNDPYYWIVMANSNPRSQSEVILEKQITDLQKRVYYLESVIAVHAKKFMDNGITTKTYACEDCWADIPNEESECDACEYGKEDDSEDPTIEVDNTLTLNNTGKVIYHGNNQYDEDADALAMTGALNTFDDEVTEKLNQRIADIRNGKKVAIQTITGESTTSTSNWWPW